ncbi:HET-domain-containing protein [Colletotrichum sublineola]|nr:HET-domain-containing protein [Colletotrichum sublineola]
MRLLHTTNLNIEEFTGSKSGRLLVHEERNAVPVRAVPRYAILSHTWEEEEEVTLQDWQGDTDSRKSKKGYAKILKSCERASQDGYDWIWIDTCCIDKTSSTELSEAINSMFYWYRNSAVCYVYLSDATGTQPAFVEDCSSQTKPVVARWYSRGWTLQEVIAPAKIRFFRRDWTDLGSKEDHLNAISRITGMDIYALQGGELSRISVARRFNWLARRKTTRVEDMAYCMLGIFDINMPLLYGEGAKAFIRLQEEIINATEDQSIFAWAGSHSFYRYRQGYGDSFTRYGIIAESPRLFERSASVAMFPRPRPSRPHPVVTRQGIRVHLLMCEDVNYSSGEVFLAVLDCQIGRTPGVLAGIRLRRIAENRFVRVDIFQTFRFARCGLMGEILIEGFDPTKEQKELVDLEFHTSHQNWQLKEVYIAQSILPPLPPGFWIQSPKRQVSIERVYPAKLWDTATNILQPPQMPMSSAIVGAIGLRVRDKPIALVLGVRISYSGVEPWCKLCDYNGGGRLSDVLAAPEVPPQLMGRSVEDFCGPIGLRVSERELPVSSVQMNIVQLELVD